LTLRPTWSQPLLLLVPPAILGAGVLLARIGASAVVPLGEMTRVALVAAAAAPCVAALVMVFVAPGLDLMLVCCAGTLAALGTATLFSLATSPGDDAVFYLSIVTRHGFFVAGGSVAMIVGAIISRRLDTIARYPFTLLVAAFLATAVTILLGDSVNGARLWLHVGPIRFQPSEIARLLLAAFIAIYLYERRHLVAAPWRIGTLDLPPAPYLVPLVGAVAVAAGVLALQNDLGMAALIVFGAYGAVAATVNSRSTVLLATAVIAMGAAAAGLAIPRIHARVLGWLDPWLDPGGRGFQFVQADYHLAAGGVVGARAGTTVTRVPEVQTDFILAAIGHQFGIVVAVATLALLATLICRCALAAIRAPDRLGSLLVLSITTLLGVQTLLIVGGTLRVLPLTGLTLPLVSYGGTSMVATFFALGVILGIGARNAPAVWHRRDRLL
jgi:cell division protein FtsW (lipid II flippase)